jgi:molybdenum cofactor cytidylyltransferase
MFTSGILLAAGSGVRMGSDKLLMHYKGKRLIDRALAALLDCHLIDEVIVVVRPDFPALPKHTKCRAVVNPGHQEGLGSSLRAGVGGASAAADAFLVSLADMPEITSELVTALIEAFRRSGKPILVPTYQQCSGHPVIFAAACRADLLRLTGDQGARQMIREHAEMVEHFQTPERAVVSDVDTPADLRQV